MLHAGRKQSSYERECRIKHCYRCSGSKTGRIHRLLIAGDNLNFPRKIAGIYQVYSHYDTNNKASILALVKSPLFA
jgi:hypothetical protein